MIDKDRLQQHIIDAWAGIMPFWPLKNLVAVNPLYSFVKQSFQQALETSYALSSTENLPEQLQMVNQKTIQWCQLFFDQGQATIEMPYRALGLYQAVKKLMAIELQDEKQKQFVIDLPDQSLDAIVMLSQLFGIQEQEEVQLYQKLLATLPGWSSYVCYMADWRDEKHTVLLKYDYLALRLLYSYLYKVPIHQCLEARKKSLVRHDITAMQKEEHEYQENLVSRLKKYTSVSAAKKYAVHFVFCMDVRSERVRRYIEKNESYQTCGMAGFFGIPIKVVNDLLQKQYDACPVLIKPKHTIVNKLICSNPRCKKHQQKRITLKFLFDTVYKALKYTFTAPFALVEILGPWSFIWMLLRFINPCLAMKWKEDFSRQQPLKHSMWPVIEEDTQGNGISFNDQVLYAQEFLQTIGLVKESDFAQVVVVTAHRSSTTNNVYASMLDCGACGGHSGLVNAKVMATILNDDRVRAALQKKSIIIPKRTYFIAAEHNTTTDAIVLYDNNEFKHIDTIMFKQLEKDLVLVQKQSALERKKSFKKGLFGIASPQKRSCDWSEIAPEWGLAGNAALVIGPRWLTQQINLEGRVFLHSYEYQYDHAYKRLENLLTAPMIVAQWINAQYVCSTLNNVQWGAGSKITQNPVGKLGVQQGNYSDLMIGLPMQSVYRSWNTVYRKPMRLTVIVHASKEAVLDSIMKHEVLQNLITNEWLFMIVHDSASKQYHKLRSNLSWQTV